MKENVKKTVLTFVRGLFSLVSIVLVGGLLYLIFLIIQGDNNQSQSVLTREQVAWKLLAGEEIPYRQARWIFSDPAGFSYEMEVLSEKTGKDFLKLRWWDGYTIRFDTNLLTTNKVASK